MVEVTEKAPTISPSCAGVAPTCDAYSGSSGSMIDTPTCEMNARQGEHGDRPIEAARDRATRPRRLEDIAAG